MGGSSLAEGERGKHLLIESKHMYYIMLCLSLSIDNILFFSFQSSLRGLAVFAVHTGVLFLSGLGKLATVLIWYLLSGVSFLLKFECFSG